MVFITPKKKYIAFGFERLFKFCKEIASYLRFIYVTKSSFLFLKLKYKSFLRSNCVANYHKIREALLALVQACNKVGTHNTFCGIILGFLWTDFAYQIFFPSWLHSSCSPAEREVSDHHRHTVLIKHTALGE